MPNQIAFYPQSSGGGSGSTTLIGKVVTSASQGAVTFSSIPQTFSHLQLIVAGQVGSTSLGDLVIQFNGDVATNYQWTYIVSNGATVSSAFNNSASSILIGTLNNGGPGVVNCLVGQYSSTVLGKAITSNSSAIATSQFNTGQFSGIWTSTATVNSLLVFSGSTFTNGTIVSLYGIQ